MRAPSDDSGSLVSGRDMFLVGAVAVGAVAVLGAALFSIGSASRFDGLKVKVVASLDPQDRTHLAMLIRDTRVASARMSASIDRAVDRGVDV